MAIRIVYTIHLSTIFCDTAKLFNALDATKKLGDALTKHYDSDKLTVETSCDYTCYELITYVDLVDKGVKGVACNYKHPYIRFIVKWDKDRYILKTQILRQNAKDKDLSQLYIGNNLDKYLVHIDTIIKNRLARECNCSTIVNTKDLIDNMIKFYGGY